ncbi:MAG: hypothetical protein RLZZ444_2858 [Pseudomonadota bacterium]
MLHCDIRHLTYAKGGKGEYVVLASFFELL